MFKPYAVHADAYDKLAEYLTNPLEGHLSHRLAVLPFVYPDGHEHEGSSYVADKLMSKLTRYRYLQVVERQQLDKVTSEMKLQLSGAIDPKTAASLGRLLGAEYLILGSLHDTDAFTTTVAARMVSVESGQVVAATERNVERA